MRFMKERTIYQREKVRIYINQCYNPGKKTEAYAVRRDDKSGCGCYLGGIKFDGAWRQYVFCPEPNTKWSAGCKEEIAKFEREITKKWKDKLKDRLKKKQEDAE